jgi:hypothetical protein
MGLGKTDITYVAKSKLTHRYFLAPLCVARSHDGGRFRRCRTAPNNARQTELLQCARTDGRCAMSNRFLKSKRRSKAVSLALASGASASIGETTTNIQLTSQSHEIFLGEEEISDVSLAIRQRPKI